MKKFKLLNKLTVAFVVVAMVLSMGMIAFAADPGVFVPEDNSLKITDIICEAKSDAVGVYNITVGCKVADEAIDKNLIGIVMLAYAKKNESLSVSASGYDNFDEVTMQIVGIEMETREEEQNSVEFKFAVTTRDADTNAYAVQPGKPFVILVNGDGLNPAAGLLTIPKEKLPATAAAAEAAYDGTVDVYSYDTKGTILATLKENFEATTATVLDAKGTELGIVELNAEYIKSVAKNGDVWTATVVIPADAEVDSEDYNVTIPVSGLIFTFDVDTVPAVWEADTVTTKFETAQNIIIASFVGEEDIKGLFLGQTVEVSNSKVPAAKTTVKITDEMIVADPENPTEFAEDGIFKYTIVIPDTDEYTVAEDVNTIAVTVTIVSAPPEPFDIVKVTIAGEYDEAYTGEAGKTKEEIVEEVIFDLQNNTDLTAIVKGANDEVETWFINEASWTYDEENHVFTAEIVPPADALGENVNKLKVEIENIEITVVAPVVLKGDVDGDSAISAADMTLLINHLAGTQFIEDTYSADAADIDGDGDIAARDLVLLMCHLGGTQLIVQ